MDSSVIIALERKKLNFSQFNISQTIYISSITVTELLIGANRANTEERRIKKFAFVEHIISTIAVIPFGTEEARVYAQILNNLFMENITLGSHDVIIAACAIANGHSVLTLNVRDFKRIKGLEVLEVQDGQLG
ncbi:MAG: PIN domain-containing protein [Rickettsia endosymbiont of Labidopullus appendiculatus]|nr:PIN domain-containing protein [Rickettsia endosymbiont of Labidopullus appendiculatus]